MNEEKQLAPSTNFSVNQDYVEVVRVQFLLPFWLNMKDCFIFFNSIYGCVIENIHCRWTKTIFMTIVELYVKQSHEET